MQKQTNTGSCRWIRSLYNVAGALLLSLIITWIFFYNAGDGFRAFITGFAWSIFITFTQWFGNSYIFRQLDKRFSWETQLKKRAIYGSLALVSYSTLAFILVQLLMYKIVTGELPDDALLWALRASWVAILVSFLVSLSFVAMAFFRNWKQSLLEAESMRTKMLQYKYESLQNQINPHFLFNSFNVLSELVYEDQAKAVDFIRQLGQLFRYVLESRDLELVPLRDELSFAGSYIYLLRTRFEEKLQVEMEPESNDHEMIVPMTLQLLLENCVKHNEISGSQPLQIHIRRVGDNIQVENTLQPRTTGPESTGTGLSNLKEQYRYFTDRPVQIEQDKFRFLVSVPILKSEIL